MLIQRNLIGSVSEFLVSGYLAAQGYEVFSAAQSHSRADLVYVNETKSVRVQVKTSSTFERTGHVYEQCRLLRKGINIPYTEDEIDEIWIVGTHLWSFPVALTKGLTSISLLSSHQKPRKTVRTYNPNDFIVVRGSYDRPFRKRLTMNESDPPLMAFNTSYCRDKKAD